MIGENPKLYTLCIAGVATTFFLLFIDFATPGVFCIRKKLLIHGASR